MLLSKSMDLDKQKIKTVNPRAAGGYQMAYSTKHSFHLRIWSVKLDLLKLL